MAGGNGQSGEGEWITFPGGELEGKRPKALCADCRERLQRAGTRLARRGRRPGLKTHPRALCFQCYRAELTRQRALAAAGQLDTASPERFQSVLPFEPINLPRLQMLKVERTAARAGAAQGAAQFAAKQRHAQIAARHALQQIVARVGARQRKSGNAEDERTIAWAIHAAELQLPESWIPFVVSR